MDVEKLYAMLEKTQTAQGYFFNADRERTMELLEALLKNKDRYGYMVCPCRLASGDRDNDKDIICPCDYRDPDVEEFGACFCALYVDDEIMAGKKKPRPIPERRPSKEERERMKNEGN